MPENPSPPPTFREALRFWIKLGWISFGGPAGQIAIMHRELVERSRWVSESSFLHALQYCMLLPGPEAQQLATYLGWKLHGLRGGIAAGLCFILPSALLLYGLGWLYVTQQEAAWLRGIFMGFQAAVIVIIIHAVIRMSRKSLKHAHDYAIGIGALGLMLWGGISFLWIIALAALCGWWFSPKTGASDHVEPHEEPPVHCARSIRRSLLTATTCLVLWALPLVAAFSFLGPSSTTFQLGTFFSKAAVVTFGGAYAVLPYVSQMAVDHYQWIGHAQMMDGLALAETTPGPLIMVLQFVGFLAGWNHPGALAPWQASLLGALITTWVTFVPCFLFILVGAPYVESLRQFPRWKRAMQGITAAVIGLIAHLAVQFTRHALFPEADTFQVAVAALVAAAWLVMKLSKGSIPITLAVCGICGMMLS